MDTQKVQYSDLSTIQIVCVLRLLVVTATSRLVVGQDQLPSDHLVTQAIP